jgi:hypothetical protein
VDEPRREDDPYPGRNPEDEDRPLGEPDERDPEGLLEGSLTPLPRGEFPGSELLVADSPREVLHRLLDGDPFHIGDRCRLLLRQKAFFLNPERLFFKSVARVSYASLDYGGKPPLERWLDRCIDRSIEDMRSEQYEEEFHALPPEESDDGAFYTNFADKAGIEVPLARLACLALNNLPDETRLAFQAIGMEGKTIHRYVAEGHGPPDRVRRLLRHAALSVLLALENGRLEDPEEPHA